MLLAARCISWELLFCVWENQSLFILCFATWCPPNLEQSENLCTLFSIVRYCKIQTFMYKIKFLLHATAVDNQKDPCHFPCCCIRVVNVSFESLHYKYSLMKWNTCIDIQSLVNWGVFICSISMTMVQFGSTGTAHCFVQIFGVYFFHQGII